MPTPVRTVLERGPADQQQLSVVVPFAQVSQQPHEPHPHPGQQQHWQSLELVRAMGSSLS